MNFSRIVTFLVLGRAGGFWASAKGQKVEAFRQEQVTKNQVPLL